MFISHDQDSSPIDSVRYLFFALPTRFSDLASLDYFVFWGHIKTNSVSRYRTAVEEEQTCYQLLSNDSKRFEHLSENVFTNVMK